MTPLYILFGLTFAALAFIAWKLMGLQRSDDGVDAVLKAKFESAQEKLGELSEKLRAAESKRDEFSGKNKELFASKTQLEAEVKTLSKKLAEYEASDDRREKEIQLRTQELKSAREGYEKEVKRVQREDEERLKSAEEERDRLWNDHETNVIAILRELCKKPEYGFTCYDNNNLPAGFDGTLKPDFLIEFLGQYVIFDAKVSKAKSLQTYITDAVKKTVDKVKNNDKIARFLYLVVPAEAIAELKGRTSFANGDYNVYIVSPDALAPVLASLKRITSYEIAEKLDPMERENIVNLIANFDWHISTRNAFDIVMAKMGADIVGSVQSLAPDLAADVLERKEKLGVMIPNKTEVKRLLNPDTRLQEVHEMESPKAKVAKKAIDAAKASLF